MNCANHPDREQKAFCQNCGKPVCVECARTVGQAVFCEPCLEIRLAAANAAAAGALPPFGTGPSAAYQAVPNVGSSYNTSGPNASNPFHPGHNPAAGASNPGLAFILGFVPGVGAMYNGQYAKGVVHLIVFAVLVSLADQNGIFGIFVAFWIFYQAFEAYHTARARRDNTALPNFFGLNDIGERFGFGRSWPSVPGAPPFPGSSPASGQAEPSVPRPPVQPPPYTSSSYTPSSDPNFAASAPGSTSSAYSDRIPPLSEPASPWSPSTDPYTQTVSPVPPPSAANRFPIGAIVLIALGVLFLVGNTHLFVALPLRYVLPFALIGVGVYIFVRNMTSAGVAFTDDGTISYRLRLVRALQSSVWVVLVGILFLLNDLNILSWGRSWPLFIIVGGVMAFVQRSVYTAAAQQIPSPSYTSATPQTPPPPSDSVTPRDREGS